MNSLLSAQFNTQYIPGLGYVEAGNPSAGVGALGDDSSVMMISGLGGVGEAPIIGQSASGTPVLIRKWYEAVPWWVWVLVAIGALSAGAYLFRNLKKG